MAGPRSSLPGALFQLLGQQVGGPVVEEFRRQKAARNEPRARLVRRRAATVRRLWLYVVVMVLFAVIGVVALLGSVDVATVVIAGLGVVVSGVLAVRALGGLYGIRRQLALTPRTRPSPPEPGYRLPPVTSSARPSMQRLSAAERSLSELLEALLPGPAGGGVAVASIEATRRAADDAAAQLRRLAGQLRAIEAAVPTTGKPQRPAMHQSVRALRDRLDQGVDAYARLVAAAGAAVAASAGTVRDGELIDATDHLAGLAAALSELSYL